MISKPMFFSQKITTPTRQAKNNRASLIDHIYTNSQCISHHGNVTLNISDHDLVYIIRKKRKPDNVKMTFQGRSYRHYDREVFQERLGDRNWDAFYRSSDVDQAWHLLLDGIRSEIDIMCPLKDIKIKKN